MASSASPAQAEGIISCPYCGDSVPSLAPIDAGLRLRLQQAAQINEVPENVCHGCQKMLMKTVSKGAVLRAEAQAKEQNRMLLWRNRVGLVKQAKSHLAKKNLSEAAVAYEKYLRVLEIIYELPGGGLTPELFKADAKSQELTVIASVYWDLLRIYDQNSKYFDRQIKAGEKLAMFVRYTPIFGHIMRKAESQTRTAKNPEAFKRFLRLSNASRPRCFIATAAFDGQRTNTVDTLCRFRDDYLKKSRHGRGAVFIYYRFSPFIASLLDLQPALKPSTRMLLKWLAEREFVRNHLNSRGGVLDPLEHGSDTKL